MTVGDWLQSVVAGGHLMTRRIVAIRFLSVVTLLALAGVACADERASPGGGDERWTGAVDTTTTGELVVRNTGGGAWARDTVVAERILLLGDIGISAGREETTFGMITGLAVDSAGRLYVSDYQGSTVRAYSRDGEYLGLVGGEGDGPGEFSHPMELATGPGGTLAVADMEDLTLLAPPEEGALPTEPVGTWTHPSFPQPYRPLRVDCRGVAFYPDDRSASDASSERYHYLRVDFPKGILDTVHVPGLAGLPDGTPFVRTSPGGGRMVPGVDRPPLSPLPSWDVTPAGELVVGEGRDYRLALLGPRGDTLRIIERGVERRLIPDAVREESASALRTRLDTLPVPASRIENLPAEVAEVRLPDRYPAYEEIATASDGRIWVERTPDEERSDATPYDVFDAAGVYLGTAILPVRFTEGRGFTNARMIARPRFTADAAYGVVVDSVTGVHRVAGFAFRAPEREEGAPPAPPAPCGAPVSGGDEEPEVP